MGLDMYLTGDNYLLNDWENPDNNRCEDGHRVKRLELELGYWRKHPDLHGFIVENFADGEDDCRPIELGHEQLRRIIDAIQSGKLPKTQGFFFGESENDSQQKAFDIEVFEKAIAWLAGEAKGKWKSVIYQASW